MASIEQTKKELLEELEAARARIAELEKEVSEREERFQSLFQEMTEGFAVHEVICDEKGQPCDYRFLLTNPAFERLTGLTGVCGKTVRELLPEVEPGWITSFGAVGLSGQPARFEKYSASLNRHYEVFAYSPAPRQFAVLFTDITDRKRMEETFRETEKQLREKAGRLQAILDAAPVVILSAQDRGCREIYGNRFARELAGVPEGTNMSRTGPVPETISHFRLFKDGVEMQPKDLPLQHVAASGKELRNYSYDWVFENGETRTMFGNIIPTFDADGNPSGAVAALTDITERLQAEEAFKKALNEAENQKRRLEAVMEALPIGVAIVDEHGGNIGSNRTYEGIWGGSKPGTRPPAHSVADYAAYHAWWPDTGNLVLPEEWASARAVREGETIIGQLLEIRRFDGTHAFVLNSAAPIRDAAGKISGAAVAVQDITELRQTQDALRESEAKYRQLSKSLKKTVAQQVERLREAEHLASMGRMVAIVAHEIRNPLLNIQLGLDTLRATSSEDNKHLEILEEIEHGALLMNNTVTELLEYGRAVRLAPAPQPLGHIIRRVLKDLLHKLDDVAVDVALESEDRAILVDAPKMARALMNIFSNAAEAMPEGGTLKIESRLSSPRRLCLSITDTGHGMDAEAMSKLFLPFHTTKTSGTGLGLPITKKIIEAHGGRITVKSKPDKGTTIKIVLPLGPEK